MYQILIIEDDEITAEIYKQKLQAEGYGVEISSDGAAGYLKLQSCKPDLLVLDMMLPGLSGAEILAALRFDKEFKDLPIIALSASETVLEEAKSLGVSQVLSKGAYLSNQIVARVTEVLAGLRNVGDSEAMYISTLAEWVPPSGRVLVVEDDPIIMQLVKDVVDEEGYSVVSAEDGGKAYKILEKDNNFVAGIFDVNMPSIQGPDLLRHMHTAKRLMKIPVLIMTAEQGVGVQAESMSAGAAIFLPKPFTRITLRMMFHALMSKSATLKSQVPSIKTAA